MVLLEIAVVVLTAIAIFFFVRNLQWRMRFEQRVKDFIESREDSIRKDAISRSARTLSGKTLEKLVPFLEKFGHDPHDVRWIGDPVDLVVFDGYSESGRKKIDSITFVEVKSGESNLSPGQKGIRGAVERKKVRWEEFRI
jgi:predicted Holliday junction resolvase-like endonuclease